MTAIIDLQGLNLQDKDQTNLDALEQAGRVHDKEISNMLFFQLTNSLLWERKHQTLSIEELDSMDQSTINRIWR